MAKYSGLRERIVAEGIIAPQDLHEAPAASFEDLRLVHDPAYVDAVANGTLTRDLQRRIGFPWSPEMVERSRRSVGATVAAAGVALDDGVSANLAGGTHHAFADRGEGFCVFNDVAVAARVLQRDPSTRFPSLRASPSTPSGSRRAGRRVRRIAVVDLDVHQGNGTAAIFKGDDSVFTFSMHGEKNFPFQKEAGDLDIGLPDGTGDDEYLSTLRHHLDAVVNGHRPDFVFYLAGADPFEGDRLGRLKMTIDGLRMRDEMVLRTCARAGLPVAISMSGGYAHDVGAVVTIHANTIQAASREKWLNTFAS